jgi:RND family efflux transporter MFP subunit
MSRRSQGKARVTAPFDGIIETQIASVGDYVKVGDPLFQLVSPRRLRAHLPFPESAAPRLQKGQEVVLTSPLMPGREFRASVGDIKPSVSEAGRALDVIVDLDNQEGLRGGGTVNAAVVVARREDAVLVPEQSVVLRPAGKVVYAVAEGKAQQRVVEVGAKRGGMVEILKGLPAGTTVALDGAGFLTNNAPVAVKEQSKPAAQAKPAESQSAQHGAPAAQAPAEAKK